MVSQKGSTRSRWPYQTFPLLLELPWLLLRLNLRRSLVSRVIRLLRLNLRRNLIRILEVLMTIVNLSRLLRLNLRRNLVRILKMLVTIGNRSRLLDRLLLVLNRLLGRLLLALLGDNKGRHRCLHIAL